MKKMLFLINPVSGKRTLEDSLMEVISIFSAAGYDVNIHLTTSEEDMFRSANEKASDFDMIVCCGGDGTLNLVVDGVFQSGKDTLIGYIPGGTTNDFANSRHIDSLATGAAAQIANGMVREVDLGLLENKPFVYVAAFGIFSEVSYQTSREKKQNFGHAAYVMEGIKSLSKASVYHMCIEHDGETLEGDFIYGMVSNSRRVGGFELPIIKNVQYDDGEMEVMLVRQPKTPMETQRLLGCLLTQVADDEMIYMFKTADLKYTCEAEIPWTRDGEFGGSYSAAQIKVLGGAVKMVF